MFGRRLFPVSLCLALALTFAVVQPAPAAPTGPVWEPRNTYALMVGILEWQDKEGLESFPKADRQDRALERQLKARGVPADHIVFLEDKQATGAAIRQAWQQIAQKAGPGSTLLFYFTGHGLREAGKTYLANYDVNSDKPATTGCSVDSLAATLAKYWQGDRLLMLGDFCHAGAFAGVVQAEGRRGKKAACLTSSTASNTSTAEWTFTAAVKHLFRGEALSDANRDGAITFAEADGYVHDQMKYAEDQYTTAVRSPGFEADFTFGPVDPVQTRPAARAGQKWPPGAYAICLSDGDTWRVQILAARANSRRVHFFGQADSFDEWVPENTLTPIADSHYQVGQQVSVASEDEEDKGTLYPAKIIQSRENYFYFVHYNDYEAENDEWVTVSRIKSGK
ncbi:MAG: caspase family protein [Candidatus Sericytochromatia bacterium]|nr:caspase family protein [Candidatus Sericytochromatia bacterium]